ncbi:hypothetical protein EKL94_15350 [Stenotrophomonas maltophilia]|uniref:Uncharacterized protein n=1 Tax=Stenotrophomonas maltophilia TaxID=40324 RepID=A0A431UEH8_STEMA|nr:hypothetical protein EKL94_15350 [Stenotrophomonas maltophilia]
MALTPPQPDPPRLRQFSAICRPFVEPSHARLLFDQFSKYSISMEIHPRMAWIYWPPSNSRGSLHGRVHGGPATPQCHAISQEAALAFDVAVA